MTAKQKISKVRFAFNGGLSAMAIAAALTSSTVMAQTSEIDGQEAQQADQSEGDEAIVITGSRIPRADIENLQPTSVVGSDLIEKVATTNIGDVLNDQVGFSNPASSPIGDQGGASIGANIVDFLGLGGNRTLTLVNGLRFVPADSGALSVDLNAIPVALVDRIETISIGGAPAYGSDAIAGTVNVILKDDFEGLVLEGSTSFSPRYKNGSDSYVNATYGTSILGGRGNFTVSASYAHTDGLRESDRPVTSAGLGFESPADPNSPFSQVLINDPTVAVDSLNGGPLFFGDQFFFNIFGNGIPLDINDPNSPLSQFDANGNLIPFVPGGGTGSIIFQQGGDGLDLNELSSLYTDSDQYNFNAFFNYELTDNVRFTLEGWFARTDATEIINQPNFNSPAFGGTPANGWGNVGEGPIPVLISNPFIPAATRASILSALNVMQDGLSSPPDGLADPTIDTDGDGIPDEVGFYRFGALSAIVGDAADSATRDTYRGVVGLEGDVDVSGRSLRWDIAYTYGQTLSRNRYTTINQPNFNLATQVIDDGNGNAVCLNQINGCVPLNVIGMPTQAAIDYVTQSVVDRTKVEQHYVSANLAGNLFDLPAGPFGFAVGVAYRNERFDFDPNDLSENGNTRSMLVPQNGGFNTKEFYGEVLVPLLDSDMGIPIVDRLEFEGAIRFIDHSTAGTDFVWTAGGRYAPVSGLTFRGNYTRSVRSPSLTELFTPVSQIFDFADDPCDSRFIGSGVNPAIRAANCATLNLPTPFTSFIADASQAGTLAGNPNLENEVAKSWTVGAVLQPDFLPGFSATVDWLDITIDGAITSLTVDQLLTSCYDSTSFPNEPTCSRFTRDSNGQVTDFQSGFVNVGNIRYKGLQSAVNYTTDIGPSLILSLYGEYRYTDTSSSRSATGTLSRIEGLIGESRHKVNLSSTIEYGGLSWFTQGRWLSKARFSNSEPAGFRDVEGIGSWLVIDTSIRQEIADDFSLQLNIDNVFDRDPPFAAIASGSAIQTYFSGIFGRRLTVSASVQF